MNLTSGFNSNLEKKTEADKKNDQDKLKSIQNANLEKKAAADEQVSAAAN